MFVLVMFDSFSFLLLFFNSILKLYVILINFTFYHWIDLFKVIYIIRLIFTKSGIFSFKIWFARDVDVLIISIFDIKKKLLGTSDKNNEYL